MNHEVPHARLQTLMQILALVEPDDEQLYPMTLLARACDEALDLGDSVSFHRAADELERMLNERVRGFGHTNEVTE
jgi:hypothetical protein